MTPAAPTATWRKVCEEYSSRLIEDLEQQVESEVESRVNAAIDAAVRGAVADASTESRRALAEELNQSVRRLRQAKSADEEYSVLLDVTAPFCEQAIVFSIDRKQVRAERMRRPGSVEAGEAQVPENLPPLTFAVSDAAAFSTAVDSRDPVIAMSTPAEVSQALIALLANEPEEKVYLFPLVVRGETAGVLYAARGVQAPALELLAETAALCLETLTAKPADVTEAPKAEPLRVATAAAPGASTVPERAAAAHPFTIAGSLWKQPETDAASGLKEHREWRGLSRDEQQKHLAAQRFARVQVAEMRLAHPEALRSGREQRDIYTALRESMDAAREKFRMQFMTVSSTMVDYLHLEMVRSLAEDDANVLGPTYPGPLA